MSGVAYGLRVSAPWVLPELSRLDGSSDVVVRLERPPGPSCQGDLRFEWPTIGAFVIRGGVEILVTPAPGVSYAALGHYLLGPVFAALLHQRGRVVLHASAVAVDGKAIAILGDSGAGKSTTAAAFLRHGHGFLADDVVALSPAAAGDLMIVPAFPQLKLWPDAADALGPVAGGRRVFPGVDKCAMPVRSSFVPRPLPLARAYVLDPGPLASVEPLTGATGLVALMRHTYGRQVLYAHRAASLFAECADVARRVPVRRLSAPRSLDRLSDLVRVVEDDLR